MNAKSSPPLPAKTPASKPGAPQAPSAPIAFTSAHNTRETIESIVVAVILAFLFRTFVAEAFVIPTGSMAPTLQGNHKDVTCPKCGYQYQANASENAGLVGGTTCPICRYAAGLDVNTNPYHQTFTGDRILVSKFSYDLAEPERWDVIVFKYPGNPKQNYIKRLIGLPNETIRIRHGDVYVKGEKDPDFHIARKPPHKIKAMLQVVDDTRYLAADLQNANWPSRWQPIGDGTLRLCKDDRQGFVVESTTDDEAKWLRYRHYVPTEDTWQQIADGKKDILPAKEQILGQLITDYYAYNDYRVTAKPSDSGRYQKGLNWVGDLALDCDVEVKSPNGTLLLDLVKGGVHYQVGIDVWTGRATASIVGANYTFSNSVNATDQDPWADTAIRGVGRHQIRLANVDHELVLWIDDKHVPFHQPATYTPDPDCVPVTSDQDPGDLEPAGIGTKGATVHVRNVRVLRDVYYIAAKAQESGSDYDNQMDRRSVVNTLMNPAAWASSGLFQARRSCEFPLVNDQFFPMGDNSPESLDARIWPNYHNQDDREPVEHFVERDLLTGKAVLVYWPHALPRPIPWFTPNVGRMRLIH